MFDTKRASVDWNRLLVATSMVLAVFVGGISASLPPVQTLIVLSVVAFFTLAAITPMAAVVALLVLAPLRTLIATEAALSLPLDIGQIAFALLLVAWVVRKIAHRKPVLQPQWTPLYVPLLLFLTVIGLNAFFAASLTAWITEALKWVVILLAVMLMLDMCRFNRAWEWIVFSLVIAGLANALIGIYIFFGGSGALHLIVNERFFRAFGTFGQPNPFGGFLGLLAPVAAMAAYGYALRVWRYWQQTQSLDRSASLMAAFYAASGAIIILGVLLSWSRGAWLGLATALMVTLVAAPRRLWIGLAWMLLAGMLIGVLWSTGRVPASIANRVESATRELFVIRDVRGVDITIENYAIIERLAHWQAAIDMARSHPFTGVGLGNYETAYDTYRLLNWEMSLGHAHNYYLNVLAEAGIMGVVAYLFVFVNLMWFTWYTTRVHPDELSRTVSAGLLGTWVYLLVHSLTDNLYVNNVFVHLGFMMGILAVLYADVITRHKKTMDVYGNGR